MGRYTAKPGTPKQFTDGLGGTSDPKYALTDTKTKQPVDNGRRNVWVTETALSTALNTSYMADQTSLFGIVVGVALLLSGFGFAILAVGGALRNPQTAPGFLRKPARTPAVAGVRRRSPTFGAQRTSLCAAKPAVPTSEPRTD